jgi:LPXTG-motif cell wall-anchored protein
MRRVVAALIFSLVLMITASAALAAEADYPPQPANSGVARRAPAAAPTIDSQLAEEGSLARTGSDVADELAFGGGLILLGGIVLFLGQRRRRSGAVRGRG